MNITNTQYHITSIEITPLYNTSLDISEYITIHFKYCTFLSVEMTLRPMSHFCFFFQPADILLHLLCLFPQLMLHWSITQNWITLLIVGDRYYSRILITVTIIKNNNKYFKYYRVVVLESHLLQNNTLSGEDGNDLYILAGHEASYWIY